MIFHFLILWIVANLSQASAIALTEISLITPPPPTPTHQPWKKVPKPENWAINAYQTIVILRPYRNWAPQWIAQVSKSVEQSSTHFIWLSTCTAWILFTPAMWAFLTWFAQLGILLPVCPFFSDFLEISIKAREFDIILWDFLQNYFWKGALLPIFT